MNVDDYLLAYTFHWRDNTSKFPNERQRLQFATASLFAAYTAARLAELVDATKKSKRRQRKTDENLDSWDCLDDPDYDNDDDWRVGNQTERPKCLCYEDISLMLLRNPGNQDRNVLAMEVSLRHHKGSDNKPKP